MKQHRVKRLVVIDEQRVPIGMITRSNLVRIFFDRMRKGRAARHRGLSRGPPTIMSDEEP